MPIRLKAADKFQWTETDNGQPIGHVAQFGAAFYVMVCPICSCLHELPGLTFTRRGQKRTVRPRCLLKEYATSGKTQPWHETYQRWTAKHPGAKDHIEVRAVFIGKASQLTAPYTGVLLSAPVAPRVVKKRKPTNYTNRKAAA